VESREAGHTRRRREEATTRHSGGIRVVPVPGTEREVLATEGKELLALVRAGARSVLPDKSIVKIGVKGVAFLFTRDLISKTRTKGTHERYARKVDS
jgi:hypothetical protein